MNKEDISESKKLIIAASAGAAAMILGVIVFNKTFGFRTVRPATVLDNKLIVKDVFGRSHVADFPLGNY